MKKIIAGIIILNLLLNQYILGIPTNNFDTLKIKSDISIIQQIKIYKEIGKDLYQDESLRKYIETQFLRYLDTAGLSTKILNQYKKRIEEAEKETNSNNIYNTYLEIAAQVAQINLLKDLKVSEQAYFTMTSALEQKGNPENEILKIKEEDERIIIYDQHGENQLWNVSAIEYKVYPEDILLVMNTFYIPYGSGSSRPYGNRYMNIRIIKNGKDMGNLLDKPVSYITRDYTKVVGDVLYFSYNTKGWSWNLGTAKNGEFMENILDEPVRSIDMIYCKVVGDVFYFKHETDEGWNIGTAKNGEFMENILDEPVRSIDVMFGKVVGDILYFEYQYQAYKGWNLGTAKNGKFMGNLLDKPMNRITTSPTKVVGDVLYFEYQTDKDWNFGAAKNGKFMGNIFDKLVNRITMSLPKVVGDVLYFSYKTVKGLNLGTAKNGKFMGNILDEPVRLIDMMFHKIVRDFFYFPYKTDEGYKLGLVKNEKFMQNIFDKPMSEIYYMDHSKVVGDFLYFSYVTDEGCNLGTAKNEKFMGNILGKSVRYIDIKNSKVVGDILYFKYKTDKSCNLGTAKNEKFIGNILGKSVRYIDIKNSKVVGDILYFEHKTDEGLNLGTAKNGEFMENLLDEPVRYINMENIKIVGDIFYFEYETNEGKNIGMIQNGKFIGNTSKMPRLQQIPTQRDVLEEEEIMGIDDRVWNKHKDTIIDNIKKQQLQYLRDNYIRELGRLEKYDQVFLDILLKGSMEYTDLIHYLSMYLASDEMKRAGEILGELNEEMLNFLLITFNCNMDDTTVANDFKNMLSKGSKFETKKAFRKYIIDIGINKGLLLEEQIKLDHNVDASILPTEIKELIRSFACVQQGWGGHITSSDTSIMIQEKIRALIGYNSWEEATTAIEKLGTGISVNLFLRDLSIFAKQLKTTPNLRPSIHKSLLNAA